MFDVGFSELLVIAVVALVVIGPERLPKVARTAGLILGRLQRYVGDVKADISREIQLDELKRLQQDVRAQVQSIESAAANEKQEVESALNAAIQPLTAEAGAVLATVHQSAPGAAQAVAAGAALPTPATAETSKS